MCACICFTWPSSEVTFELNLKLPGNGQKRKREPGNARAWLCHPAHKHLALWLHLTVYSQALGPHLIVLLGIQHCSSAPSQAWHQAGAKSVAARLLVHHRGLSSLPHWGLAGGKCSVKHTCKDLLSPPPQRAESDLTGQPRLGAKAGAVTVGGSLEEVAFPAGLRREPCRPHGHLRRTSPHHPGSLHRVVSSSGVGGGGVGSVTKQPGLLSSRRAPAPRPLGDFTN